MALNRESRTINFRLLLISAGFYYQQCLIPTGVTRERESTSVRLHGLAIWLGCLETITSIPPSLRHSSGSLNF